jgi:hypothetical protein
VAKEDLAHSFRHSHFLTVTTYVKLSGSKGRLPIPHTKLIGLIRSE